MIYLPIFFLTYLLILFLTYLPTYFLIYFLTYLLIFFLTYQRQNTASTISLKNHSTNSIFTSDHTTKLISMTTLCLSNGNSIIIFDCIGPPRQKAIKSKDAKCLYFHIYTCHMHQTVPPKSKWVQEMQSWQWCHKYISWRVQTWSPTLATLILSPLLCRWLYSAHHLIPIHIFQPPKMMPKYERLQQTFPALTRPPHLEQTFLYMLHTTCFPPQPLAYKRNRCWHKGEKKKYIGKKKYIYNYFIIIGICKIILLGGKRRQILNIWNIKIFIYILIY